MKSPGLWLKLFLIFFVPFSVSAQTVSFSIGMAQVSSTDADAPILPSSLFQLVDLGPNGIFDPIEVGSWVGGDDFLIDLPFPNTDGWTSAQAFDASDGPGEDGVFLRQFTFTLGDGLTSGDKVGIRWFPSIEAINFDSTTTTFGLPYGQFTQLSSPLYQGTVLWIVPGAGSSVDFDQMLTPSFDPEGLNPNSSGVASFTVVPEISSINLLIACCTFFLIKTHINNLFKIISKYNITYIFINKK